MCIEDLYGFENEETIDKFESINYHNCSIVAKYLLLKEKVKFDIMPINYSVCYTPDYKEVYYNAEKEIINKYLKENNLQIGDLLNEIKNIYKTLKNATSKLSKKEITILRIELDASSLAQILDHNFTLMAEARKDNLQEKNNDLFKEYIKETI